MSKPIIKIASVKGNLLGVLNTYLNQLGLEKLPSSRVLFHRYETEKYILEITLLRWNDIKMYCNAFDLIIYGNDQWLESGYKNMIVLQHFEQNNCRLSLLVPNGMEDEPLRYFLNKNIATSFPNIAKNYLGVNEKNILLMTGSVEAAIALGWAESIFDIVESGTTAKENGLSEYKTILKFGAILATTKPEKLDLYLNLGLIKQNFREQSKGHIIAFDGNDGCGKSTLSKHLVQQGIDNELGTVLICPYSGYIGKEAKSLFDNGKYIDWAVLVGLNHWKMKNGVNQIYDRNILTFVSELLKQNCTKEDILNVINYWKPLPDVLFYCKTNIKTLLKRVDERGLNDEFDEENSLIEYNIWYEKAYEFIKNNTNINIVELDTSLPIQQTLEFVDIELKSL